MFKQSFRPDIVFQTSWEVCNKVGGIYTVLSTLAKTLNKEYSDSLCFIGPDVWQDKHNPYFTEDNELHPEWRDAAVRNGLPVKMGRWNIPGSPAVALVDFRPYYRLKNEIYSWAWQSFGVDSLRAYGDYDESSMFSYAAGRFAAIVGQNCLKREGRMVYQAHEWMSGLGMLFLKKELGERVSTIFTTHATSIGRSITSNNKNLYQYFDNYDGDQMAFELNMEAKHSIEKRSAHLADCFTTVSQFTARECARLLDKEPDVVLPNGFESDFVPRGAVYAAKRRKSRKLIFDVLRALTGRNVSDEALIVSTSGRNDFRCKGYDVFLEAVSRLKGRLATEMPGRQVVALIEVPCWTKSPRTDLLERLKTESKGKKETVLTPLSNPFITHELFNFNEDRIVGMMQSLHLTNEDEGQCFALLIPSYLEGSDGIFDTPYYDMLVASDLCVYPSYYEPWGYTPLESAAFGIPCITTDLSGFGQWVNTLLNHEGKLTDGVAVFHRDDTNYFQLAEQIAESVTELLRLSPEEKKMISKRAKEIAGHASWSNFADNYIKAFDFAFKKNHG